MAAYTLAVVALDGAGHSRPAAERVLALTRGQINYRWRLARAAAGLTEAAGFRADVRIKDLRHTFAVHYLKGGGNLAGLMGRMGHTRGVQSLAYAKHERRGTGDMEETARALGLHLPARLRDELATLAPRPDEVERAAPELPAWWFDRHALPRTDEGELQQATRYAERGTAGWAEDAIQYDRARRRLAEREDTSGDSDPGGEATLPSESAVAAWKSESPASLQRPGIGSGGGIRTRDLRVMSPTRCHFSTPQ